MKSLVSVSARVDEQRDQGAATPRNRIGEVNEGQGDDSHLRVRVPYFPVYSELRHLLRVWPGRSRKQVAGLRRAILGLQGTRQSAVDWTEPPSWIPARLKGNDRELAQAIWSQSNGEVNPRHIYGHWLLARRYGLLLEDSKGLLTLSDVGRNFRDEPRGAAESAIDRAEGLTKLLTIVADSGPVPTRELAEEWGDYLGRRSAVRTVSMASDTMRRRLTNLLARGLIERKSNLYSATADGLDYLQTTRDDDSIIGEDQHQVWALVRQNENTVRNSLRELIQDMNPVAFEHLVKRLLEEMGYQAVRVTARSNDGGVDVVGDIELGITSVRECVQVKRHRRAIQRKDLDALRGSLYRFQAVRGTIVTTSRFARGTRDAAFATGVLRQSHWWMRGEAG